MTIMQMTATTINDMVHYMHIDKTYKKSLADMLFLQGRPHLLDDVWEEMMLLILEYKQPSKLLLMYNNNQFFYWWLRIITNNVKSKNSPVYYKYVRPVKSHYEMTEMEHLQYNPDLDKIIDDSEKINALRAFMNEAEKISREHKIGMVCFNHYYFEQKTIRDIADLYRTGEMKMSHSKIYSSIKFAEEFIMDNFNFNQFKD